MDAIVIAGGIPSPEDPLYEYTQGENKALLDIHGKPMVQWVLDALNKATKLDKLVLIGLPENSPVKSEKISDSIPTQGDLLSNIKTGILRVLEINPQAERVMVVSSDIPTITSEMVDWLVDTSEETEHDAYYNVITRQIMEARFPHSNRSYVKLKGIELCGGDMNVLSSSLVTQNDELWRKIVDARKSAFRQAALIGFDNLLLFLLRLIDLDGAVKRVSERMNIRGRALVCPYAEIGMDVDKPHQFEIIQADLEKRFV